MKRKISAGYTSVMLPVFIQDTSSTTGAGLSGVTHATSGLTIEYRRAGQSAWTIAQTGSSPAPVSKTLGTYVAWGIVADGSLAGAYEVDLPDAAFAAGARFVMIRIRGVTNMLPSLIEVELDAVDYQNATSFGISRLDAAVSSRLSTLGTTAPTGWIDAAAIATDAITSTKIAANAIGASQIATGAITAAKFAASAIDASAIATGAITSAKFAASAITSTVLATDCIGSAQLASSAVVEIWSYEGALGSMQDTIDNLGGVGARFDTMIEQDVAVWRYTVNALEQAPSGGGGGGAITVYPLASNSPDRVNDTTITCYFNEATSVSVSVTGTVDLTTLTLSFIVEGSNGVDSVLIANGSIARTATTFTVTVPTAVTGKLGQYKWALRNSAGNAVLAKGVLQVVHAANADA